MKQPAYLTHFMRLMAGILIAGHGIYRIAVLKQYLFFVSDQYDFILPKGALSEALIVMFPFAEFFVGTLLLLEIAMREALNLAVIVTLILIAFLVLDSPSGHIFYHLATLAIVVWLKSTYRQLELSKSEL